MAHNYLQKSLHYPFDNMFYSLGSCPNCKANCWQKDFMAQRVRRYSCLYCGQDVFLNQPSPVQLREMYPQGDVPTIPELLAS